MQTRLPVRFDHVGITVVNLSEAVEFYRKLLNAEVVWVEEPTDVDAQAIGLPGREVALENRVLKLPGGGAFLELHQYFSPRPEDDETPPAKRETYHIGLSHMCVAVDSEEALYAEWDRMGRYVKWNTRPRRIDQGGLEGHWWCYSKPDPNGVVWQLVYHPDPQPLTTG